MKRPDEMSERKMGAIVAAWRELQSQASIGVIQSKADYSAMVDLLDSLIDRIGDDEKHELAGLIEVVGVLVQQYEEEESDLPDAAPRDVLKFLMEAHGLKQSDLKSELGSQGVVSEILNGKREINARQAKALAERFKISPSAFL